jgi:transposase
VAAARAALQARLADIEADKRVFVDETWIKTNMARSHGRAPRGKRLKAKVPFGRWKTMTLIAAIRTDGIFAPAIFDGPVDGAVFRAYAEQCLAPELKAEETVMMDNLASHKAQAIADAITAKKANLEFLPAYSPDFNPIEPALGQIKAHLRKAASRTMDTLETATAEAIAMVLPQHCKNYFIKCGYRPT